MKKLIIATVLVVLTACVGVPDVSKKNSAFNDVERYAVKYNAATKLVKGDELSLENRNDYVKNFQDYTNYLLYEYDSDDIIIMKMKTYYRASILNLYMSTDHVVYTDYLDTLSNYLHYSLIKTFEAIDGDVKYVPSVTSLKEDYVNKIFNFKDQHDFIEHDKDGIAIYPLFEGLNKEFIGNCKVRLSDKATLEQCVTRDIKAKYTFEWH